MLAETKFRGIFVDYESTQNPYFKLIVDEALAKLSEKRVGRRLLRKISRTNPPGDEAYKVAIYSATGARGPGQAEFIDLRFDHTMTLKSGCSAADDAWAGLEKRGGVGSVAGAINRTNAENGTGSRVRLRYNDKDIYVAKVGGKNIMIPAFVPLAHELIHALHSLEGTLIERSKKVSVDGKQVVAEEARTTGIGKYSGEEISENAIRGEWGFPNRKSYP